MNSPLVREWMTISPYTTSPDTPLIDAYQLMKSYEIRRLPVLDDDEILVGVVTLSDIRAAVTRASIDLPASFDKLENLTVSHIMTRNPITIHPEAPLHEAAQLMFENKFGGLPVLMGQRLVGIISESDLFRFVMAYTRDSEPDSDPGA